MKRNNQVTRTSVIITIELIMERSGINRKQATIAFNAIIHYIRAHPSEPISNLAGCLFDVSKNHGRSHLN